MSEEIRREWVQRLCQQLCEGSGEPIYEGFAQSGSMSKEGPPALPYPLAQRVTCILRVDYEENRMPQLRWYGECFGEQECIERAYIHPERDARTVKLYIFAL